jgi:hypothetical protein
MEGLVPDRVGVGAEAAEEVEVVHQSSEKTVVLCHLMRKTRLMCRVRTLT